MPFEGSSRCPAVEAGSVLLRQVSLLYTFAKRNMTDVATRDDIARVSALFTRGAMDAPDLRGESMVTKHLEKLQQEKEKQGFAKMQALHPSIGPTVCAIALEETAWDGDAAHELLSRFEEENREHIATLLQVCNLGRAHHAHKHAHHESNHHRKTASSVSNKYQACMWHNMQRNTYAQPQKCLNECSQFNLAQWNVVNVLHLFSEVGLSARGSLMLKWLCVLQKKESLLKSSAAAQAQLAIQHMPTGVTQAGNHKRKHSSHHEKHSDHKKHKSDKHGKTKEAKRVLLGCIPQAHS